MKRSVGFFILFVLMVLAFSCTKERGVQNGDIEYSTDNEHIKSEWMNGSIVHQYLYDQTGKIVEENCLSYYKKYLYNENDRLFKVESAFDRSGLSSSMPVEIRTEFMTSKNSTADSYSLYQYDSEERLSKIDHYFNEAGKNFEYRSMQTFEYEESNIVKVNLYYVPEGKITQFRVYTYDDQGNVVNEKYYSNLERSEPELISETSYKYDNYKNPFQIFSITGSPGFYTNVNNIIETSLIRHYEVPGFDKYSTENRSYEYNSNGYPVKAIFTNSVEEYRY